MPRGFLVLCLLLSFCPAAQAAIVAPEVIGDDDGTHTFSFSGVSSGGSATAQVNVRVDWLENGYTRIKSEIWNTSPIQLNSLTGDNAPAITGWGFDTSPDCIKEQDFASWSVMATNSLGAQVVLGTMGGTDNIWTLAIDSGEGKILLDLFADNSSKNVQHALYNPDADPDAFAPDPYFTKAYFEVVVKQHVSVLYQPNPADNRADISPYVRFQNVGRNGAGSLKLSAFAHGFEADTPATVPEPMSLVVWSGLAALVGTLKKGRSLLRRSYAGG
jgi:hypothetical protein